MRLRASSGLTIFIVAGGLLFGSLASPVYAQIATMNYGERVQGAIADTVTPVQYAFIAKAGDTVSINANAANARTLDLALTLSDPFHNTVGSQQSDTGSNAAIENFYLARDGIYEIDVWGNSGSGDFDLTLDLNSSAADREVVFNDTFDDNRSDWATGGDELKSGAIQDGKYVVEADCQGEANAWFGAMGLDDAASAPMFDKDFVAEVQVQFAQAEGEARAGWVFAVQPTDAEAVSVLYYQTDATWNYRLFDTLTRAFNDTFGDTKRKVSIGDGRIHNLGLSVTSAEVRMWIDGQQVARFEADDPLPGTIGLAGGCAEDSSMKKVHAEFDNLVVTAVK